MYMFLMAELIITVESPTDAEVLAGALTMLDYDYTRISDEFTVNFPDLDAASNAMDKLDEKLNINASYKRYA